MKRGPLSLTVERVLREPFQDLLRLAKDMEDSTSRCLDDKGQQLQRMNQRLAIVHPGRMLELKQERWQRCAKQLDAVLAVNMERRQQRMQRNASLLRALGPDSAFARGFSLTMTTDGELIRSAKDVAVGQKMLTRFADGEVASVVE